MDTRFQRRRPLRGRLPMLLLAWAAAWLPVACGGGNPTAPSKPTSQVPPTTIPPAPAITPKLDAPTSSSPVGGVVVPSLRPSLAITNSVATGIDGSAVTYRFEVSELNTFPQGARTDGQDGVLQASGTTSWQVHRDLIADVTYYWRARATSDSITTDWSNIESFRTPKATTAPTPTPNPNPTPAPTPPPIPGPNHPPVVSGPLSTNVPPGGSFQWLMIA